MKTSPFFAQPVVRCRVAGGYISAWSKPLRGGKVVVDVGAEDFSEHVYSSDLGAFWRESCNNL